MPLVNPELQEALAARGEVTVDEIQQFINRGKHPDWYRIGPLMVTAWGQRAAGG